jgi:hypothetical protein
MKLYTEEVLRNSMNSVKYYMEHYDASVIDSIIDKHIKALGPIELPSDEEINNQIAEELTGFEESDGAYEYSGGFEYGAKWVIEQIKKQDRDQ